MSSHVKLAYAYHILVPMMNVSVLLTNDRDIPSTDCRL